MLLLPLTWLALWLVCVGLGGVLLRLAPRLVEGPRPRDLHWLGLGALVLLAQLVSFVHRLDPYVLAVLAGLALVGLPTAWRVRRRGNALLVIVAAFLVANSAARATDWYDTMSTHIQQVTWARSFPVVPGLGNLNGKLAFDQAHHLLAALLDGGPFNHRVTHVALGFLVVVTLVEWLLALTEPDQARVLVALTLPYLLAKAMSNEVASLSGDLAMAVVFLPAMAQLARRRIDGTLAAQAGLLFAMKFSANAFVVVALVLLARRDRRLLVLPALLVATTIIRRVMLTGWPLYPIPVAGLHLSWAMPKAAVVDQYRWIQSWARMPRVAPDEVLDHGFLHWFVPWFDNVRGTREWALTLVAAAGLFVRGHDRLVLGAALASVAYWFFGAPDLRFGGVFIWTLFAVSMMPLLVDRALLFAVAAALVVWCGGADIRFKGFVDVPVEVVRPTERVTHTSRDGRAFEINVPKNDDLCGDAPIPCSPYVRDQQMRHVGDLASGYSP